MSSPLALVSAALFPTRRARLRPSQRVAIVVPLSSRPGFSRDELISLQHLETHLGRYDKFFLVPEGSPVSRPGFRTLPFARKFFGSATAHNHLLFWPGFYRAFSRYEYIFFYHLDALVFSDQLETWCQAGVDYIGPPWLQSPETPWVTRSRVGNGGFTLLRVDAALRVLYARYRRYPTSPWIDFLARNGRHVAPLMERLRRSSRRPGRVARLVEEWDRMQHPATSNRAIDIFWSDHAVRFDPSFKVASLEQGMAFAFEMFPRRCLELNGGRLPFGCHAWPRYDRAFWEPFLLPPAAADRAPGDASPPVPARPPRSFSRPAPAAS